MVAKISKGQGYDGVDGGGYRYGIFLTCCRGPRRSGSRRLLTTTAHPEVRWYIFRGSVGGGGERGETHGVW